MTRLFVDASALVAMMTREPEDTALVRTMSGFPDRVCSPVAIWEATAAVARKREVAVAAAQASVAEFLARFDIGTVPIGPAEADAALAAWARYGRGSRHAANLNMGDCFAYACATTNHARLLYKGEDFIHTDLA